MGVRPARPKKGALVALVAGVTVSALVTGGGLAIAAIPSTATGDITSCVSAKTGAVRVIDYQAGKRCVTGERTVSWSKGFRFRGAWSSSAAYAVKDLVTYAGSTYLARTSSTNAKPGASTAWVVLAAKGAAGANGANGAKGDQGLPGAKGDQGLKGDKGDQGLKGDKGDPGYDGFDGATILSGAGAPTVDEGYYGDYYLDTTTFTFYGPKTESWAGTGLVLKGADGKDGNRILSGTGAPAATLGALGDFYLDNATSLLYGPKSAAGWDHSISLKGQRGADGNTVLGGAGAPAAALGAVGDFYLDSTASRLYGPKSAAGWDHSISLKGDTGSQGPKGTDGSSVQWFTAAINVDGLSATVAPAADDQGNPGCWGSPMGHSRCASNFESAMMVGGNVDGQQVSAMYVRAPGLDVGQPLTVTLVGGYSPGGFADTPIACSFPSDNKACHSPEGVTYTTSSDRMFSLKVSTTSPTPLHGMVYVTFKVVDVTS